MICGASVSDANPMARRLPQTTYKFQTVLPPTIVRAGRRFVMSTGVETSLDVSERTASGKVPRKEAI